MIIYFINDGEIVNTDNCIAIEFKDAVNTNQRQINFKSEQQTYWYSFIDEEDFNDAKTKIINGFKKRLKYIEI